MKSKSQQRREAVMKTGKPTNSVVRFSQMIDAVKKAKWKPKIGSNYWVVVIEKFKPSVDKMWGVDNVSFDIEFGNYFRTRALAEKALKKVKQVLKDSQHS